MTTFYHITITSSTTPTRQHWCQSWNSKRANVAIVMWRWVLLKRLWLGYKSITHSLCSPLILVEETILVHSSFQKPGTDQVQSLHRHVNRRGRHRCSLRNPVILWHKRNHCLCESPKEHSHVSLRHTCGECLHFLQHHVIRQVQHQTDKPGSSRREEQGCDHLGCCICSFILNSKNIYKVYIWFILVCVIRRCCGKGPETVGNLTVENVWGLGTRESLQII